MGDAPEVGHLPELTPDEQKSADALAKLVQEKVATAMASQTDASTRPGFSAEEKVDIKEPKIVLKSLKRLAKSAPEGFNINLFPKGDLDNFSVARWAMASQRSVNTTEGTQSFKKNAPWETQYYAALQSYGEAKAQGDMVSGQDGGFLAPEEWSANFIDQLYPQMALSHLPIRRMPMGTRVNY